MQYIHIEKKKKHTLHTFLHIEKKKKIKKKKNKLFHFFKIFIFIFRSFPC